MRFEIKKFDGYTPAAWNGTIEDLEGFNVKVIDSQIDSSYWGSVENGYAVSKSGHGMTMISKALRELR